MRILVDTQILLWATGFSSRLPEAARELIQDPDNIILFSTVSIWEVAIKTGRGYDDFTVEPHHLRNNLLANDYEELPLLGNHVIGMRNLQPVHKDPFDRILIAQAFVEEAVLLTSDKTVARYGGLIRLV